MSSSKTWGLSSTMAAAAVASASSSSKLTTGRSAGSAVRAVLRRTYVTSAITRSPLRRRALFPSELLSSSRIAASYTQARLASSAAAASSSSAFAQTKNADEQHRDQSQDQQEEAEDKKTPDASLSFSSIAPNIHKDTLRAITVAPFKYTHMSAVQAQILPLLPELARPYDPSAPPSPADNKTPRDLLVKAKTGTGKTLAFLVPAIESRINALEAHVASLQHSSSSSSLSLSPADIHRAKTSYARTHVGCLVISPTRELATQIAVEASNLTTHHKGWEVQVLLGGENRGRQLRELRRGRKDVVVATPGRLLDMMENEPDVAEVMKTCKMLILDEADTLLDMGFREDINRIVAHLPSAPERQTFLFSATVSRAIQQIAQATLSPNHRFVNCVSADDSPVHAHIPQYHTLLKSGDEVLPHVLRLLAIDQLQHAAGGASGAGRDRDRKQQQKQSKVVIFLSTTNSVILFSQLLRKARDHLPFAARTSIYEMHAKREMKTRTRVSAHFRSDTNPSVLITSDVSARGVDYPGVTRVIQIGAPSGRDIYVHRVGRTGRGSNKEGRGDLILMPWEMDFVRGKLRDVGLKPVTAADTTAELNALIASPPPGTPAPLLRSFTQLKADEIPSIARELTQQLTMFAPEDIQGGFASQLGFYIGRYRELGLDIQEVAQGLKSTWREMWGLERDPVVSRQLMEMMQGGRGGNGSWGRAGRGGRDRDRDRSFSSRGGERDRGFSRGGGGGDRAGGGGFRGRERDGASNPYSISGAYASRNAPGGNDGYGYAKGSRQGFGYAQKWARNRESEWEDGGAGPRGGNRGERDFGRGDRDRDFGARGGGGGGGERRQAPWMGRGSRKTRGGGGFRDDVD